MPLFSSEQLTQIAREGAESEHETPFAPAGRPPSRTIALSQLSRMLKRERLFHGAMLVVNGLGAGTALAVVLAGGVGTSERALLLRSVAVIGAWFVASSALVLLVRRIGRELRHTIDGAPAETTTRHRAKA